jgi:hypothetical protein
MLIASASARRNRRAREIQAQLDAAARNLACSVTWWRGCVARHRVAFAVLGGGLGGIAVAILPWRSLARCAALAVKITERAAAWFVLVLARIEPRRQTQSREALNKSA